MVTKLTDEAIVSKRVQGLRQSLLQIKPRLSCERVRSLIESYRETEGEPPAIRRAKVFEKYLKEMTIFIDENPIVGTLTQYRAGVQPYPEMSCKWMKKEFEFSTSVGKSKLSGEDEKLLEEAVEYWKNRCLVAIADKNWSQKYPGLKRTDLTMASAVWLPSNPACINTYRSSIDYGKVVNKGLKSVIQEAETELKHLPFVSLEALGKREFLKAVIISCNAVIAFAQRYATLADHMAQKETNTDRKKELERIANTCRCVPENPARGFYEAIQAFWFTHLASLIEGCSSGHSPGRFSVYMYPFYKKDRDGGAITEEEAIELLELLFIKCTEIGLYQPEALFDANMSSLFQNISMGGVTPDGEDATNELDFLLVEAQRQVKMIQPTLSVLYHDKMPEAFLLKCAELVKTGIGMPAFFNNDLNIQRALDHGASLNEARDNCIVGCVESGFSHANAPLKSGFINMPKLLELTLNDGKDPLTGKQVGLKTGNFEQFKSYEELHNALKAQFQHQFQLFFDYQFGCHSYLTEFFPVPFTSSLLDDCIKRGKDVNGGGARYNIDGACSVGMVDLADSLAAIKRLVFEEQKVTLGELRDALAANFEGHEKLHQLCLDAPKYGNADQYADSMLRNWYRIFEEEHRKYHDQLGNNLRPIALSVSTHFPFGMLDGALPSGRKAKMPLADGSVSASPGMDKNGPTALILSATRVIDTVRYGCSLLNMKFHPSTLKDMPGLKKILSLIKTYFDLGGHHVQFNVVSAQTLKDAQLHPENYRHLIVRVAGFSAFFIHLDPVVQNEIIKRTELML